MLITSVITNNCLNRWYCLILQALVLDGTVVLPSPSYSLHPCCQFKNYTAGQKEWTFLTENPKGEQIDSGGDYSGFIKKLECVI